MKKSFDGVEMKRKAQKRLQDEYEARVGEFSSFADFVTTTASESQAIREFRARVRSAKEASSV